MTNKKHLTEEKETLFITLYAKAQDYRSQHSILNDKAANDLIEKENIDFAKYQGFGNTIIVIRAKQIDEWIKDFIEKNANAVVVYLGCGLDSRITRIQPPASVNWFDIDYPEVIELRKQFFAEYNGYTMIASSVTDQMWLKNIPANRPALIIAEGLLEYLTEAQVKILLNCLTDYFAHGQIIFDVMNSFAIKSGKEKLKETTGAVHKWAVDDVARVDKLNTKLKRTAYLPIFQSVFMKRLPFKLRFLLGIAGLFSKFRTMIQLMKYEF